MNRVWTKLMCCNGSSCIIEFKKIKLERDISQLESKIERIHTKLEMKKMQKEQVKRQLSITKEGASQK